jgi:predicted kinase
MLDALKQLFENNVISEDIRADIASAWDRKIQENREQATQQLREEFAQKYEHDKQTMIEAIDKMVTDRLTAEIQEFTEDRAQLSEAKAKYAVAIREHSTKLNGFVLNSLAKEITELHTLKENESRVREISQKIIQNSLERDEMLNMIKTNFQKNDEMIRQILNKETNALVDKRFARIIDWWNFHIVNEEGPTMRSSNIWTMFKRDNPDLVGEIQANDFKDVIYTFIAPERIVKPRNKFGALEIKNLRWKVDRGNAETA